MRNECNIIRDILPLYTENMVSDDTVSFVEEHLKTCDICRRTYEQMKEPQAVQTTDDVAPLLNLKKKIAAKKIQTIILTAVFVIALLVSAFAALDAPIYIPYSEDLVTVKSIDGGVHVTFNETVTDFDYNIYLDPDNNKLYYCDIEAWTSLWDKWFSNNDGELSATICPNEPYPITVMYVPNNGNESVCIYGETDFDGSIALPKLTLGYYLIFSVIALAVAAAIWLFVKKKPSVRIWIERMALYPLSYIISHFIIVRFTFISYSMPRDFLLILFVSLLFYCALLLAHSIWKLQKEIREINHKIWKAP